MRDERRWPVLLSGVVIGLLLFAAAPSRGQAQSVKEFLLVTEE